MRQSCFRRPLPVGGLYHLSARTWLEIHSLVLQDLASVAILVMCERLASQRYLSGTLLQRGFHRAADLAYWSAFPLLVIP